ncbi:MAG: hypothetical protein COB85_02360, partial [Bacteroidetes bacterium]
MDALIGALVAALEPPWNYILGTLALLLIVGPKMINLRAVWIDLKLGRKKLDLEKQQLEILKLQYEIEALKKEHEISELKVPDIPVFDRLLDLDKRSKIFEWFRNSPRVGKFFLKFIEYLLIFYIIGFGLGAVGVPISKLEDSSK